MVGGWCRRGADMRQGQRGEGNGCAQLPGAAGHERARLYGGRCLEQGVPGARRETLRRWILHWRRLRLGGAPPCFTFLYIHG